MIVFVISTEAPIYRGEAEKSVKNRFPDSLRSLGMTLVGVISTEVMRRIVYLSRHFDRSADLSARSGEIY